MTNLFEHKHTVTLDDRLSEMDNKLFCIWFTGLSGCGKSTLANALEKRLFEMNLKTYILDGDNIRMGLNSDLDFTDEGRKENIRRISEVNKLFLDSGTATISAFISPFEEDRQQARNIIGEYFIEVFIDTPLEVCESRDPKGLYDKARKGIIPNFTGIDSPYERPSDPEIVIKNSSIDESVDFIIEYLLDNDYLNEQGNKKNRI